MNTETPAETTETAAPVHFADLKKFEDVPVRKTFGPDQSAEFNGYVGAIDRLKPATLRVVVWGGMSDGWPAGYSMSVFQLQEKKQIGTTDEGKAKFGRVTQAIIVWPVPLVSALNNLAAGQAYVNGVIESDCMDQVSRPFRKQELAAITDEDLEKLMKEAPVSLNDFATRAQQEGLYKVYNDYATSALQDIRKMAPKSKFAKRLTAALLRDCLESAEFARSVASDWEDKGMFVVIINGMRDAAIVDSRDPAVYDKWIATRDETDDDDEDQDEIDLTGFTLVKPAEQPAEPAQAETAD